MVSSHFLPTLTYYGGKSGRTKLGQWVASVLPQRTDCIYIELCVGLGGVWLQRAPAHSEILNDLNGRIVNFWRAVRDNGEELARLMKYTPYSHSEFMWAVNHLDDRRIGVTKRALAFSIVIMQNLFHSDGPACVNSSNWVMKLTKTGNKTIRDKYQIIEALQERAKNITLYNTDALKMLRDTSRISNSVVYFDPPYTKRHYNAYHVNEINVSEFTELFQQHKGAIAISGCDGEWDHLGWERHELDNVNLNSIEKGKRRQRVEQVWVNYDIKDKEILW